MNKIINYIEMGVGVFLFVLGFFDMQKIRFGYYSPESFLGLLLLSDGLSCLKIDNLKERINKLEIDGGKNGSK
jgi:hypothetical protein